MASLERQGIAHDERPRALDEVLRNPGIWRAQRSTHEAVQGIATGHAALDAILPDGGWPPNALTELLVHAHGIGELSLLMPTLRDACAQGRGIALLGPPWLAHARAWEAAGIALERLLVVEAEGKNLLWATEQVLRSGECAAALLWSERAGRALDHRALQRLHLAANTGHALCFVQRPPAAVAHPSPAPLRVQLAAHEGRLQVEVVKCRGPLPAPVSLPLYPAHWHYRPDPQAIITVQPRQPVGLVTPAA